VCARSLFVITAAFAPTRPLAAGSASASLAVTARLLRTCSLSTNSLSINNYDLWVRNAATDHTASTELTVVCKRGATSVITVGAGSSARAVVTARVTFDESNKLKHEAHNNSGLPVWSDAATDLFYHSITDGTALQSISVYRRIPGSEFVGALSYDMVLYTINF
jgi:hypothetical protein